MNVTLIFGLFGLIVGSFLNVLILRWGERRLTGRSSCTSCGRSLAWYELVPIVSWLALLGRCRTCAARISLQYPLVEAGSGVVFALIGASLLPMFPKLLSLPIAALLIAIAVYDLRHTLIPDAWVWALNALSVISIFAFSWNLAAGTWHLSLLAGPLVALPLFAFWFFSRGAWMGFGDVKLGLAMGWLLGASDGLFALFLAFVIGGAISAVLLFYSSAAFRALRVRFTPSTRSPHAFSAYTMKSEVPFGPFLVVATLIVWISHMHGLPIGFGLLLDSL